MLDRLIIERLQKNLNRYPAVALFGARQVGKTTLSNVVAGDIDSIYLDLEAPEDLAKLSDPTSFLGSHHNRLIILDEIQRAPDLFQVLRGLIDKGRLGIGLHSSCCWGPPPWICCVKLQRA